MNRQYQLILFYLPSSSLILVPIVPGCGTMIAPASSRAFAFSSAETSLGVSTAPAWPIVRPSGAVRPATMAIMGFGVCVERRYSAIASAALISASPPISPMTMMPSVSSWLKKSFRPSLRVVPVEAVSIGRLSQNRLPYRTKDHLPCQPQCFAPGLPW